MLETVLKKVYLVDPEKEAVVPGDLGIRDGKIAAVAAANTLQGETEYDLEGWYVAPGMIDVHAHIECRPRAGTLSLAQGVTTTVGGNCGGGPADFAAFTERCREGFLINQMDYVGHNAIRNVLGIDRYQEATGKEVIQMCALAEKAMEQGAIGISFGLGYAPGYTYGEVEELMHLAGEHGGFTAVDTQLDTEDDLGHLERVIETSRKAGTRLLISHFVYQYGVQEKLLTDALAVVEAARRNGADVWIDSGMYTWWVSGLGSPLFEQEYVEKMGYDRFMITTGDHKGEVLTPELYRHARAEHGREALLEMSGTEEEVYRILEKPYCALSSDAGEYAPGEGHPQVAGSFARFFHQMVIVRRKMTLPQAIAKVTLFPAKLFRLSGKGRLRESADADLVVFDPASYRDTAWFGGSDGVPDRMAEGVKMVFVNGKPAFAEGKVLNAQAGRLLTVRNVR
ncbi:MAG: amidohydrolase family protein [Clostridia bacterium]|nr:amidohydrolase family protein [Clostridia bacterium]